MFNLILIMLSLTSGSTKELPTHMTIKQAPDGAFIASYSTDHSKHARNKWDTTRLAADEGNNAQAPVTSIKHF